MEMIERVARAMWEVRRTKAKLASIDLEEWGDGSIPEANYILEEACSAIRVMREPTESMKKCSDEIHWGYSCHTCGGLKEGWYAMIDAALK